MTTTIEMAKDLGNVHMAGSRAGNKADTLTCVYDKKQTFRIEKGHAVL